MSHDLMPDQGAPVERAVLGEKRLMLEVSSLDGPGLHPLLLWIGRCTSTISADEE